MRYVAILGMICLGTASLVIGCGDGETNNSDGGGGNGTSSSSGDGGMGTTASSSSSGNAGAGGMTTSSSSSSSSSGMLINGCDQATAADHLADATVTVLVGSNGFTYDPPCIRIKKGADVTFTGNFSSHPTVGGTATSPPVPDSASPIKQTNSGTAVTFTFDTVGTYPYYCEYHTPNMAGVVYVE